MVKKKKEVEAEEPQEIVEVEVEEKEEGEVAKDVALVATDSDSKDVQKMVDEIQAEKAAKS